MLLPNILAHNEALDAGSDVAIFMRGEVVTESSSANIAIVRRGELWTHPASRWVLDGVTRTVILELAREMKLPVVEEPFRRIDLCTADEILLCGTRSHLASITHIDGREVCNDAPGPLARQLHDALLDRIASECNSPSVT
jgi:D-alanine transaminase